MVHVVLQRKRFPKHCTHLDKTHSAVTGDGEAVVVAAADVSGDQIVRTDAAHNRGTVAPLKAKVSDQ
jgi:hypothetical protein